MEEQRRQPWPTWAWVIVLLQAVLLIVAGSPWLFMAIAVTSMPMDPESIRAMQDAMCRQ